ncbi:MAG: EexN family lipoprotein [Neisseriaceae bacterium]|nr:EexN family lipoprotein [Neisseriaceae bacterium]
MKKIALMIVATAFLAACGEKQPTEEVHTVEWFKQPENSTVAGETLYKCRNDPGTLGQTPNCINVEQALKQVRQENYAKQVREDKQKAFEKWGKK